jgi:hypothetical protein
VVEETGIHTVVPRAEGTAGTQVSGRGVIDRGTLIEGASGVTAGEEIEIGIVIGEIGVGTVVRRGGVIVVRIVGDGMLELDSGGDFPGMDRFLLVPLLRGFLLVRRLVRLEGDSMEPRMVLLVLCRDLFLLRMTVVIDGSMIEREIAGEGSMMIVLLTGEIMMMNGVPNDGGINCRDMFYIRYR